MKPQQTVSLRLATIVLAVSLVFLPFVLPVSVAAGGPQVDVCGTGNRAADCNTFIEKYINPVVVLLTSLVGIAAVISIIIAGIQYSSSADDPGTVTKAKMRIFNTILGLVVYIFLLALFNYLIPGGFF